MDLYDSFIRKTELMLGDTKSRWAYQEADAWKDAGASELVLLRDAAYELGGGSNPAVNFTAITSDKSIIDKDEVLVYGPDLKAIKRDVPFARIVILGVSGISDDKQEAYNAIRNMEFVKYHVFPEGYMMRVSPESSREQIRVSKKALRRGISFRNVGFDFIKQYKKNPQIRNVRVIFITDPKVNYKELLETAGKINDVTKTMNTILEGLPEDLDCASCSFKPVCDEVVGLKELHFGKGGMMNKGKKKDK